MKNYINFIIATVFCMSIAYSQGDIKFGLTGGLYNNNTDIDISAFGIFDISSIDAINETGFYIGAFVDIEATSKLHVQPELMYAKAGDLDFVNLPVLLKYYLVSKFNIQAGPQLSFSTNLNDIKSAIKDIEGVLGTNANLDDVLRTTGVDLVFGVGFDISEKFFAQARYIIELTDRYSGPLGSSLDVKPNTFTVGVGYAF